MKTTLFLLSTIVTLILSSVTLNEIELHEKVTKHGTAVIAAKTHIKGGDKNVLILPPNLTAKQAENLTFAYRIAKEDGHKYPERYQGLIYQESKAGGMKGYAVAGQEFGLKPLQRYYGVPQIKLGATKDVLKKYPALGAFRTDEELVAKLITDDKWAIRVGSKYFKMIGESPVAYNKGPTGAIGVDPSTNDYTIKVANHVRTVVKSVNSRNPTALKLFNRKTDRQLASSI
jgi:hypothetical protein